MNENHSPELLTGRQTQHARQADGIWRPALRRFLRHKVAILGGIIITLLALGAILAPSLTPYEFDQLDLSNMSSAPSSAHLLGTDSLGRDLLTRVLYGGRISLTIGVLAMSVSTIVGALLGTLAGYLGGLLDDAICAFIDLMLSLPPLFVLIILGTLLGSQLWIIIAIIGLVRWMATARLVRGTVLSLKNYEFVTAAQSIGATPSWIILRHMLPNTLSPIIISATLGIAGAIITESTLSFLGLGVQPPTPTWGNMLREAQEQLAVAPWVTIAPGLAIFLAVMSINFIGDGLRDAFDPRHTR
ncbi:MAG: ABC transporter permease [Anaerolineales bacterium]|nr:ABC transporter permease [Anaerolineales bacterium]